jgi:hypothetical protein
MASKQNDSRGNDPELTVLERVQELTWALLDEDISDDEMSLLDTLLLTGDKARDRYIECIQLHTDLMAHYAEPKTAVGGAAGSKSPVLSFLNAGSSSIEMPSPRTVD